MTSGVAVGPLAHSARTLAQVLLAEFPHRLRRTVAVSRRARELAGTLRQDDHDFLLAAAWLHDVGYSDLVAHTGFAAFDGAEYLRRHDWPLRIAALVAHHSGTVFVARTHGLARALTAYPRERSPLSDALTYADQTIGPAGDRMTVDQRVIDTLRRHGPVSPNALAHRHRGPYLRAVAARVDARLRDLDTLSRLRVSSTPGAVGQPAVGADVVGATEQHGNHRDLVAVSAR